MKIVEAMDAAANFFIHPKQTNLNKFLVITINALAAISTFGCIYLLCSLWLKRRAKQINANESQTTEKTDTAGTQTILNRSTKQESKEIPTDAKKIKVTAIEENFTTNQTIEEQRQAHNTAKEYLKEKLATIDSEVIFVSPEKKALLSFKEVKIEKDLDATVFFWEPTEGVQDNIQKDGKQTDFVVLYGAASQFNYGEAPGTYTVTPGNAVNTYKDDKTQGPECQLQFRPEQVEWINDAANLGTNGLCHILDEKTKDTVKHGYFMPEPSKADAVIEQLKKNGHLLECLCVGAVPLGQGNQSKVYEMLVAAPALGYMKEPLPEDKQNELAFLCALYAYRAQFQQAIALAKNPEHKGKKIIFKPTPQGLGVFSNPPEAVARAFYAAAKEYEKQLKDNNIQVKLQIFQKTASSNLNIKTPSHLMAQLLGLNCFQLNIKAQSDIETNARKHFD